MFFHWWHSHWWILVAIGGALGMLLGTWQDYRRSRRRLEQAEKDYYERMRSNA